MQTRGYDFSALSSRPSRAGFSMIEVLVAATILTIIVMMLGMLFQQTSLAWRTGSRRAEAYMQVRSAIGAIQRDASAAVDARFLPERFVDEKQNFSGGKLLFYTLTGTAEIDENDKWLFYRSLKKITYETSGKRTEQVLQPDGGWVTKSSANVLTFAERQSSQNKPQVSIQTFIPKYDAVLDPLEEGLPLSITFSVQARSSGNTLDIGAWSFGPDGAKNTRDDIKTWIDK